MALHREDVVCELVLEGPLEHAQPGSNTQGGAAAAKSHQGGKQGSVWEMSRGQVRLENRGLRRVKGENGKKPGGCLLGQAHAFRGLAMARPAI